MEHSLPVVLLESKHSKSHHCSVWMTRDPNNPSRMIKPVPKYVLIDEEFKTFCDRLEELKVPIGYCVDIGNCIRKGKFGGLKSHDYHVLIQTLMPFVL